MTVPTRCCIHELYLPKLCSVLHGRITRGFPEALDKVIGRVERETFRDSPHRHTLPTSVSASDLRNLTHRLSPAAS